MDNISSLTATPLRKPTMVVTIDWDLLATVEQRRLRELGLDEGVEIEVLHRSRLGGGPIACRIGRMTVAMRRSVANAIRVAPALLQAAE
jgi:ferrous iron transport protein A